MVGISLVFSEYKAVTQDLQSSLYYHIKNGGRLYITTDRWSA